MYLGAHVSIRKGYLGAAEHARYIGANAFQYFPKNPRSISIKSFDQKDAEACAAYCREHDMVSIAHTPYPTSLCVEDESEREEMIRSILNDLAIADACGSLGIVVHFGKHKSADPLKGYQIMIQMLNDILSSWEGETLLLIENNAGQGIRMGIKMEELVQIRHLTQYPEKIGFCLDTCHAFASGLWSGDNWEEVERKGKELGFFPALKAIHLNDSKYPTQSFRDRHENIGKGKIGEVHFKQFFHSDVVRSVPWVLETPNSDTYTHQEELRYIKSLIEPHG